MLSLLWACVVQPCEYFSDKAEHTEQALHSSHHRDELPCGKVRASHSFLKTVTSNKEQKSIVWLEGIRNTAQKCDGTFASVLMEIKNDNGSFVFHSRFPLSVILSCLAESEPTAQAWMTLGQQKDVAWNLVESCHWMLGLILMLVYLISDQVFPDSNWELFQL